jgi:uncharacterized protein
MIVHDSSRGEISDGPIRYVMLRADVLMGISRYLPEEASRVFLFALSSSVERHAVGSFERYQSAGADEFESLLDTSLEVAATLGWGRWARSQADDGRLVIQVANSPFAVGFGASVTPVCSAIVGALSALFSFQGHAHVPVAEYQCAAQGASSCRFLIGSAP